jgi:pimeloyl-ACP methyl ester carboxylesterase
MTELAAAHRDAPGVEVTSGVVTSDGLDIYYEYGGEGPVLLLIPGGGGDGGAYAQARQHLAGDYTVVSYDWRGNSRSRGGGGDLEAPVTVAQHSRDAVAVIKAMGVDSALVYGCSAGAIIALDLLAHHPGAVVAAIAHEPPTVRMLPDADHWLRYFDELHDLAQQDLQAAALRFFSDLVGIDPAKRPPELQARLNQNPRRTFTREMRVFVRHLPDIARIRTSDALAIMAAGSGSAGHYYARTAPILADMLACPYVEFPGYHDAWIAIPEAFAAKVRQVFAGYRDLTPSSSAR